MRLPPYFFSNPYVVFPTLSDFIKSLEGEITDTELQEVNRLAALNLPPVVSGSVVAAIFGVNPGIVWAIINKPHRYYRTFNIPKGNGQREIHAPRVVLKIFQKWLSVRLADAWRPADCVYGFVAGRTYIDAAIKHKNAKWVFSCDIQEFFPSTPSIYVKECLQRLGYNHDQAALVSSLCCFRGGLAQGSPASPVLSNICADDLDKQLLRVAEKYGCNYTRYADDVTFSGSAEVPSGLTDDVAGVFHASPWELAPGKTKLSVSPARLKVHGLLVHTGTPKLTKGYRNKLRAYRHLAAHGKLTKNLSKVNGHLSYAADVDRRVAADNIEVENLFGP
ncbi:Reverse transcriptase (RNA-dependent DNA polymerase) [Azotobacter beijerinckii]|uniref:RNA-directed DNA polymerase n=2 Tax=Azotobacter beijerinckii TaxID=170623 RepID=A0A1H9QRN1_9GAMM|nr:Reverse transcriptase (RNA-dependent DNA polymerase) [Azotobacter beijerinckii]